MPRRNFRLHEGRIGSALAVRITPRAGKNRIMEVMSDGTIKIQIAAPPVEGQANDKLVSFLAEVLKVPKSRIEIVAGMTGRDKLISVLDLDAATVQRRIHAQLD